MKQELPHIRPLSERAILIEFEENIKEDILKIVLYHKNRIENFYIKEKVEVTNTYNSLLIIYIYNIEDVYSEIFALKALISEANITNKLHNKLFNIPVCYDPEFGLDLVLISKSKNLSVEEIISIHTTPVYTVYFIGFLPGFPYLGGLDERLYISRKNEPRLEVKKGAVGIGEKQTGIYPISSPGGWQIIGNSPVDLFDKKVVPPCQIMPGDKVKFYAVSKAKYLEILEQKKRGKFQLKTFFYGS
ncbi:5-oxoprolinase subunit PxpB [Gillisia sp. M10.2A]|uniref:5-oxoprolinase subunit PxpB n=1 Tax=Gillisia lutea TaxID=2909668 RepID=A0ABS9EJS8_9FLAO|nr:5-oxoprolinase subunit PxpB [Gillisia lutea]MCF4102577.1 5-oxoprolinase subunit PxpB [Gillisia lutea]